jgi:hypothetical protein
VLLIVAWRVAGHLGLDYFLLPPPGANRRFALRRRSGSVPAPTVTPSLDGASV